MLTLDSSGFHCEKAKVRAARQWWRKSESNRPVRGPKSKTGEPASPHLRIEQGRATRSCGWPFCIYTILRSVSRLRGTFVYNPPSIRRFAATQGEDTVEFGKKNSLIPSRRASAVSRACPELVEGDAPPSGYPLRFQLNRTRSSQDGIVLSCPLRHGPFSWPALPPTYVDISTGAARSAAERRYLSRTRPRGRG